MPCNAVATARAKVGNLAQVIGMEDNELTAIVFQLCQKQFENEYFGLRIYDGEVMVNYSRRSGRGTEIAEYAKRVIGALAQRALAAKVAKLARVTGQTVAANGAMVLEVEL